ncbi:hypothetical protein MUK42_35890 [Musa troglodytarum]|uniref:Uncharacterized protein n=1 Tax=Musa troglodytarum TaxID=320322 RepID=A0A9E7E9D5_9LILI|nr:hypothetical protein MUK42_35890 [Musa troglodytarum]
MADADPLDLQLLSNIVKSPMEAVRELQQVLDVVHNWEKRPD